MIMPEEVHSVSTIAAAFIACCRVIGTSGPADGSQYLIRWSWHFEGLI